MAKKRKRPTPTKFQVGDRVRVKQGIRDADYPDMPLGGWAGSIELPTKIRTTALSPKDEDDRVRMVFDLTSNDPLPDVDDDTLEAYHEYLAKYLVFPFEAEYTSETGPFSRKTMNVQVISLGDPDDEAMIDDMYGIMCEATHERRKLILPLGELEVPKGKPNRQLIEDYGYWFCNNR